MRSNMAQAGGLRERAAGLPFGAVDFELGDARLSTQAPSRPPRSGGGGPVSVGAWTAAKPAAPVLSYRGYPGSAAEARGYTRAELSAVSELGFHYLVNGGLELSRVLFSGLVELLPSEPYFHLALGLTRDQLGDRSGAMRSYSRAAELNPADPRPEINRAELCILESKLGAAQSFLRAGLKKALASGEAELKDKAAALLSTLSGLRRGTGGGR